MFLYLLKGVDYNAMTEEEQIALAIQMSMNEANPPATTETEAMEQETKPEGSEDKSKKVEADVGFCELSVNK